MYPRLLSRLRSARWSIQPSSLQAVYDSLGAHLRGGRLRAGEFDGEDEEIDPPEQGPEVAPLPQPVAIIPIYGIIGKHLSSLETRCGGVDVDRIEEQIAAAIAEPVTQCIILDIDSPGGVATGIPELAAKIRTWSEQKMIIAFTSSLCCSAAYWLASGCKAIIATPTADLGSIGVYIALVDDSEWWKQEGIKLELIKAGKFKAAGISGKALTAEERALFQGDVDAIYEMFTADVRAGRRDKPIADETMQGQTFMGASSQAVNLCDAIVPDLGQVVAAFAAHYAPTGWDYRAALHAHTKRASGRRAQARALAREPAVLAPAAAAAQPVAPVLHLTVPVTVNAPVSVDSRLEKDSIQVSQSQQSGGGAKRIERDAQGRPIGIVEAEPAAAPAAKG